MLVALWAIAVMPACSGSDKEPEKPKIRTEPSKNDTHRKPKPRHSKHPHTHKHPLSELAPAASATSIIAAVARTVAFFLLFDAFECRF